MSLLYTLCQHDDEMLQILDLQLENLRFTKSPEVEADQGFTTVRHDLPLLREMNMMAQHVLAKDGEKIVGYALAMTRDFRDKIPLLSSMFDMIDNLEIEGEKIGQSEYIVMGQVCVNFNYRGKGVFQNMYNKYFEIYKPKFRWVITEIAARNTRSLKAHMNIGFEEIHRYIEPGVEEWIVVRY